MISAVATAVSAAAIAVSVFFVFPQLRRLRLSQEVSVALALYNRSTSPEMLEAAGWVKSAMPSEFSYQDYLRHSDARRKLESLWYYFEFIGVLVNRGYVREELVFDQQGAFIAGIWDKTEHLIKVRRQDRQSPQYLENFELLAKRFVGWATKHPPKLAPREHRRAQAYYEGEYRSSPLGGG